MSTSIYLTSDANQIDDSFLVAGASAADHYWLPQIHALGLDLLEVSFSGGLTIMNEYYPKIIEQVEMILLKFKEIRNSTSEIDDALARCSNLLAVLKDHPPESGYKVYIG